ncbi:mechanosensitive ion channel domain-containing protein [Spirillospora sp. NPDC047279]|uniref:mechanosensitive ion channel family protein n=1 Tax=Spirillospora sp. NPDC047279 TaxID=3155478 RepID=UPI0033EF77D0
MTNGIGAGGRPPRIQVTPRPRLRRTIVFGVLALCAAVAARFGDPDGADAASKLLAWTGAFVFLAFAVASVVSLGGELRRVTVPRLGEARAAIVRLCVVLAGAVIALITMLGLVNLPIGQLILGGALTGVILGIAGQQTLANVFAGIVLLYSHPFDIGDEVHIRSGPLGGELEGTVQEIGLLYVQLKSAEGRFAVPNSLMQSAAVARLDRAAAGESVPARR